MKQKIEITRFQSVNKGHLLGYIDIRIDPIGLCINNMSVFMKDNQRWFAFPAKEYKSPAGETKFAPFVFLPDPKIRDAFMHALRQAFKEYCTINDTNKSPPMSDDLFDTIFN